MKVEPIIACLLALLAIWRAHVAGAAYVIAQDQGKSNRGAIAQTVTSLMFALLAVWIARQ